MKVLFLLLSVAVAVVGCKSKPSATDRVPQKTAKPSAPLPGSESMQKLLAGVGKSAAPSAKTQLALGDILGSGGALGGVTAGQAGVAGGAAAAPPSTAPPSSAPTIPAVPPASAGGDCSAVTARLTELIVATAEANVEHPEARQNGAAMIREAAASAATQLGEQCTALNWPQPLKDCILTAADAAALQACEQFATPEMRAAANQTGSDYDNGLPVPTTPAPKWTGGNDCAAVGEHAAALAAWQVSNAPPAMKTSVTDMIEQMRTAVETACGSQQWPEQARACILAASSVEALNACAP